MYYVESAGRTCQNPVLGEIIETERRAAEERENLPRGCSCSHSDLILSEFPTVQPPIRRLERSPNLFRHDCTYTPQSQGQDKRSIGCTVLDDITPFVHYFCHRTAFMVYFLVIPTNTHSSYRPIRYINTFIDSHQSS